ncbi:MAG TPA: hypothetical protein VHZ26_16110 [Caulobacteraceae bacterium]|jgi:hypothetical protein|nr:hypothetical protein [Caulobacteraceae bacterium]
MAEGSSSGAGMGMVVGALVVIVAIIAAVVVFGGGNFLGGATKKVDVNVSAPQIPSPKPS